LSVGPLLFSTVHQAKDSVSNRLLTRWLLNTEENIPKLGIQTFLGKGLLDVSVVLTKFCYSRGAAPTLTTHPLLYLRQLFRPYTAAEKAGMQRIQWFDKEGTGYLTEQSTQPQTLGYSLSDSPVGLLAWIYEKLVNWTDNYSWTDDEGELTSIFERDTLTWVLMNL